MQVKDNAAESPKALASEYHGKLDWGELRTRLDRSQAALQRRLTPTREEKQKILHARARSLATRGGYNPASADFAGEEADVNNAASHSTTVS